MQVSNEDLDAILDELNDDHVDLKTLEHASPTHPIAFGSIDTDSRPSCRVKYLSCFIYN